MSSVVPEGWEQALIGDIGSFFGGLTGKTAKDFGDGHPFLTYMQVFLQKTSDKDRVNFVSINESEKQNRVDYGDILFTTSSETPNEIGMTSVFLEEDWSPYLNSFCFGLRVESPSSIDPLFAKYVLRGDTFRENMRPLAQGSTRFNLSKGNLAKLNLLLPPLPEQKKIASILTSVDEVIENTQKQIDKLQDLKKATMNELLTQGIGHTEFKDSELGRIPKSWGVISVGQYSKSIVPGRNKPASLDGNIPWITITDLEKFSVSKSKQNLGVDRNILKSAGGKTVPVRSVILSVVGEFGISSLAEVELVINQQLHGFVCDEELHPEYLCFSIRHAKRQLERLSTQTTISYLNKENVESLKIVLPPLEEQYVIAEILLSIMHQQETLEQKLSQTQSLKKSLMQDLLTGKVRVTVN